MSLDKPMHLLFSLAAILGLSVSATQASPEAAMPATLQISLDTSTVSQGEPIPGNSGPFIITDAVNIDNHSPSGYSFIVTKDSVTSLPTNLP